MGRYLTPTILRSMGTGLLLQYIDDTNLDALIEKAETDIDLFMGFPEDSPGFAPGLRTEYHPYRQNSRRIYLWCFPVPVRAITDYGIITSQNAATGQLVRSTQPPNSIFIDNSNGYVELVGLSTIVWGLTQILAPFALQELQALVTYTAGYRIAQVNKRLYPADAQRTAYPSRDMQWDTATQVPVIYKNGVALLTGYTLDTYEGTVHFDAPYPTVSDRITADYTYQIPRVITQATKACLMEGALIDYFLNNQGLMGLEAVRSGVRAITRMRRPAGVGAQWQTDLDGLRIPQIESTG